MLHKTHHLWDYSKEALERIAEVVKDSEAVDAVSAVDISSCLKTKKKKKSKKKGRDTSTEADEVEKAMAGLM